MWRPPSLEVRELQALVRRLESLIERRVAEENRLSSGISTAAVRPRLEEHIAYLIEKITEYTQAKGNGQRDKKVAARALTSND